MIKLLYVDTWHLRALMPNGYIWTCYGIKTEEEAKELAGGMLKTKLAPAVTITHTMKETKRSRWVSREVVVK